MNQDMSIIQLVLHASFVVQLVMVILMAISIASWAAIVRKLTAIKRIQTLNEEFEQQFWSGTSLNDLFAAGWSVFLQAVCGNIKNCASVESPTQALC